MGFFDNLSKKASETYKNTAEKTSKLTRELKLKALISDDKEKIKEIYIEIGKKVYEKHIREENIDIKSDLIEECSKIDAYSKEIEDMNNEVRSLKNLRLCNKCAAEISINAKFCPKCGVVQEVDSNEVNQSSEESKPNETIEEVETNKSNETSKINEENETIETVEIIETINNDETNETTESNENNDIEETQEDNN